MRNIITFILSILVLIATAQEPKKIPSPKASAKSTDVEITYGQPSKRDRVIFGELVPYGKVWRTGANEATEITFKKDAVFGEQSIKAGTYTLFTIPSEQSWTIILNKQLGQWGAYEYEKYKLKNVLKAEVAVYELKDPLEKLTFTVKNDKVTIEWDDVGVSIPLIIKK